MNWDQLALLYAVATSGWWLYMATSRWPVARWASLNGVARAFATAVTFRAPHHRVNADACADLVRRAGENLRLPPVEVARLRFAAQISDLGLAAVPHRVLNGQLSAEVDAVIAGRHPEIGGAMLDLLPLGGDVAELVRCHHSGGNSLSETLVALAGECSIREQVAGSAAARDLLVIRLVEADDPTRVDAARALLAASARG